MAAAVEAHSLYRFFHAGDDETLALRGVSMTVAPGEMVAVTGPSGSGKSTLLACLAGLDEPDGGTVRVAGERMSRRPEPERAALRARHIGVLFQSANLLEHLSVEENLVLAQRLAGGPDAGCRQRLLDHLGLAGRRGARPSQLSGEEAALAGLAVALANDPALVLADEPTGSCTCSTGRCNHELPGAGPLRAGGAHLRRRPSRGGGRPRRRLRDRPRPADRPRRPVGLGKVDLAAPAGRARRADRRHGVVAGARRPFRASAGLGGHGVPGPGAWTTWSSPTCSRMPPS